MSHRVGRRPASSAAAGAWARSSQRRQSCADATDGQQYGDGHHRCPAVHGDVNAGEQAPKVFDVLPMVGDDQKRQAQAGHIK